MFLKTLGYQVADNYDIETDFLQFYGFKHAPRCTVRDIPAHFMDGDKKLKTQTSAMQVRIMEKTKPPLRVVCSRQMFPG